MIAAARALALIASVLLTNYANAQDGIVTYKSLSPELALDLARAALDDCRERGYQVAVAVVDFFLRRRARHTILSRAAAAPPCSTRRASPE